MGIVGEIRGAGRELKKGELDADLFEKKIGGRSGELRRQVRKNPKILRLTIAKGATEDVLDLAIYCERGVDLFPLMYKSKSFSETVEIYFEFLQDIDRRDKYLLRPIFKDVSSSELEKIDLGSIIIRSKIFQGDTSEINRVLEDCEALEDTVNKIPEKEMKKAPLESILRKSNLTWKELSNEVPWKEMDKHIPKRRQRIFNRQLAKELTEVYFDEEPKELIEKLDCRPPVLHYLR
jgi:hypothetical protein